MLIQQPSKESRSFIRKFILFGLRRKKHEVYYYLTENRYEVDFLN